MKFGICLCLTACLLILSASAFAEQQQAGIDIAVLNAGVGARALGMGSAFTAVSNNVDAPYWNPAGLGKINFSEITTMQTRMSTDANHYYISYIQPFLKGALGVSWIQIGISDVEKYASPEASSFNEVQSQGVFSYYTSAYLLSYGTKLTEKLFFGLTAKYLTNDMVQVQSGQGSGYSLTPGILLDFGDKTFGLKIDELLNDQSWGTGTSEKAPPKVRLGMAYQLPQHGLIFSADVSQIAKSSYSPEYYLGTEWKTTFAGKMKDNLSVRFGYAKNAFTGGVGFTDKHIEINYAYVIQKDLSRDNVHRISFGGKW